MKFNCEIDNIRTLKTGMKITFAIDNKNTAAVMKNIHGFMDKPVSVELLVDAEEQKERLNWITGDQRKKIYALLKDIAIETSGSDKGSDVESIKEQAKISFIQSTEYEDFSLSNCSRQLASDFIEYLLRLAYELGVEFKQDPKANMDKDDTDRYLKLMIELKKCCVCGQEGEIHHVEAIGMGRNRKTVDDSNHLKMALCRKHHSEYHQIGIKNFNEKYHVYGVIAD